MKHHPIIPSTARMIRSPGRWLYLLMATVGAATFIFQAAGSNPARAWQTYLVSFLLFSAIAHGAVLFSTLMHCVRARWSGPLSDLAEAFTAFFPVAFVLFLILFLGQGHLFVWQGQDLHGKEPWLNLPFLFSRNALGLLVLHGLGLAYLYHALFFKISARGGSRPLALRLVRHWQRRPPDSARFRQRMTVLGFLYMLVFALVLSMLGFDLVMSMDPHWFSTLFGAYTFVKAIYIGFGALIVLAALLHLNPGIGFALKPNQFHDIGKLFFAFSLLWADFFYAQLVVIWYGNIPEETAYVIARVMVPPWQGLAWTVFTVCFAMPFLILLNKKIKMVPAAMALLCAAVIAGMWLEHFLLLGPVYHPNTGTLPLGWADLLIALGFLGLMAGTVAAYLGQFPEMFAAPVGKAR